MGKYRIIRRIQFYYVVYLFNLMWLYYLLFYYIITEHNLDNNQTWINISIGSSLIKGSLYI